jgi:hypothetical protein
MIGKIDLTDCEVFQAYLSEEAVYATSTIEQPPNAIV